jgi:serine/threonine-protein kinase
VLLFELLAGRRPFVEDTYEGLIMAHLTHPIPSLAKVRPGLAVAASFQPVIERAMAKKPSARFKDAGVMLAALEAVVDKLPPTALTGGRGEARRKPTPRPLPTVARPGARLWRRAVLLVALAAGVAAAAATYLRGNGTKLIHPTARPAEPSRAAPPPPLPPRPAVAAAPPPAPVKPPEPPPALPVASPPAPKPEPPNAAPPPEAKTTAEDEGPAEQPEPAKPRENEGQPRSRARNPWREPVPRPLRTMRDRIDRGVHMSQKALRPAYDFAHGNPGDPRPWLLLGHAYAQLDWVSDAVERYVRAYHIDSTCRGDPQMLADLIKAAAHPTAGRAAARAVRDIYGAEAIPALEKAMERRASDHEASVRLARLRESLSR